MANDAEVKDAPATGQAVTTQDQLIELLRANCPEHEQAYRIGNMNDVQAAVCVLYHMKHATPKHDSAEVNATDAARALAAEHGIDLADVEGTGAGGRIIVDDVQAAIEVQESV